MAPDQVVHVLHGCEHRVTVADIQLQPVPLVPMPLHGALAVGGRRAHRIALFVQQAHRRAAGASGGSGNQHQLGRG